MRSTVINPGRTFVLVLDHGEDFLPGLTAFCAEQGIRSGFVPSFIGAFRSARLVGSCEPLTDPEAPLWEEITVEALEALGAGTLAWDAEHDRPSPHIHVAAGVKDHSADGRVSHLVGATVQFTCEITIVEALDRDGAPAMTRRRTAELYDVPLLDFGTAG